MYSEEVIELLEKRIAWDNISSDSLTVDDYNLTGISEIKFSRFHKLAVPSNVYSSMDNEDADDEEFNLELRKLRKQSVLYVLSSVFSQSKDYLELSDYSDKITNRISIFDEAIGYTLACSVIEMFISTSRSNIEERNTKMAVNNLKLELEGYKNENGHTVARGLKWFRDNSIKNAVEYFFPDPVVIKSPNFW